MAGMLHQLADAATGWVVMIAPVRSDYLQRYKLIVPASTHRSSQYKSTVAAP
jgi:hypothetical protein